MDVPDDSGGAAPLDLRRLIAATTAAGDADPDPSAPLSAPDLRLLVDRLHSRSLVIKSRVRSCILSHLPAFSAAFSAAARSVSAANAIAADVDALLGLLSPGGDGEIRAIVDEIRAKSRERAEKKEALLCVQAVADLVRRLGTVGEGLANGKVVEAAAVVRELRVLLGGEDECSGSPAALSLLRQEWRNCFDEVQEALAGSMEKAVLFESGVGEASVSVKYNVSSEGGDDIELRSILTAIEQAGVFDYGFAKVADLVIRHVVVPVICDGFGIVEVEGAKEDSGPKMGAILRLSSTGESEDAKLRVETSYSRLKQIIQFLNEFVFLHNGLWMQHFGRLTWSRIADLVASNILSKVVPSDASEFSEFQKIIEVTAQFEIALKGMKFISATDCKDERLSSFVQNVEVHFASKKRSEILAQARGLLLKSDFTVSLEDAAKQHKSHDAGETAANYSQRLVDMLFHSGQRIVSEAAYQLVRLVHCALQDACGSSMKVGVEFYHAARDALLLYEAIIPVKLEKQLNSINQVAILVHNDCLYLSQEIFGLAFQYRSNFPSGLKENAVFVDLALKFHQRAEEILEKQLQLVIFSLNEAIDGADGFQNTHQRQQYESAKFSIEQVVFILEKVRLIWDPLLLQSEYKKLMCKVLDSVLSRIATDVLQLDDLADVETLQLQNLIHVILENLSSLLDSLVEEKRVSEDNIWALLDKQVPSLCKLRKVADLLDMTLKSITSCWESGDLFRCGFSALEVQSFIKAIFTDSPLRKECLWRIEDSNSWE